MQVKISEFGALLTSVLIPDHAEGHANISLGYDDLKGWEQNDPYFGATVGRFGNRIANGVFEIDGKTYQLATNNAPAGIPCALHGGKRGFNKVTWKGEAVEKNGTCGVKLTYHSPDGEEGYPGNLEINVTYFLNDENEIIWEVEARSDAPTPINIIQHTYWNLSGDASQSILDHELTIPATHFLPTCAGMIPTGEQSPVADTPLDFLTPSPIGLRIEEDFEPLTLGCGYDHCFVLDEQDSLKHAGTLHHPPSGRTLTVLTNQPGVQLYTGNHLEGTPGRNGITHQNRVGICLETQNFPDAPNKPEFPNAILRPGECYHHKTVMKLSW